MGPSQKGVREMMMTEGQKYLRLMLAFDGLAEGKGMTGRVIDKDDYGREFAIDALVPVGN